MGMDQYLLIPFLVGWTSIYQLFWGSPGVQGFDTLPYVHHNSAPVPSVPSSRALCYPLRAAECPPRHGSGGAGPPKSWASAARGSRCWGSARSSWSLPTGDFEEVMEDHNGIMMVKWSIYRWFTHEKWWFSIVMLVYQRVWQGISRSLWILIWG